MIYCFSSIQYHTSFILMAIRIHHLDNRFIKQHLQDMLDMLETPLLRVAQGALQYADINVRINAPADVKIYVANLNEKALQIYFEKALSQDNSEWKHGLLEELQSAPLKSAIFYVYEEGEELRAGLSITNGESSQSHFGKFSQVYATAFPE